jgi:hypothetical protein
MSVIKQRRMSSFCFSRSTKRIERIQVLLTVTMTIVTVMVAMTTILVTMALMAVY